jgi:DNA-binding NarL/FixJ family response regulator
VRALARDPGTRVVALAGSPFELARALTTFEPRVVVLGAGMGSRSLLSLLDAFSLVNVRSRILLVGGRGSRASVLDALAHGAHGHLTVRAIAARLAAAVRALDAGQAWCSRRIVPALLARLLPESAARGRRSTGRWSNGLPPTTR